MKIRWVGVSIILWSLSACGGEAANGGGDSIGCGPECRAPRDIIEDGTPRDIIEGCGRVTLAARTAHDDYEAATFSFRFASEVDDERILNNWDLLFGNDMEPDRDHLSVNMVTDDRSYIVDLGLRTFCKVPEVINLDDFPVGQWGEHDSIDAVEGHTYLVRSVDSDHRQFAVFWIYEHQLNEQISIGWYRSPDPERFIPPERCL